MTSGHQSRGCACRFRGKGQARPADRWRVPPGWRQMVPLSLSLMEAIATQVSYRVQQFSTDWHANRGAGRQPEFALEGTPALAVRKCAAVNLGLEPSDLER